MNHTLASWLLPFAFAACAATDDEPTDFMRFVQDEAGAGRLESALVNYVDDEGRQVALVGAVHIGDRAYYEELNDLFTGFDAVLYELVAERGMKPEPGAGTDSPLSMMQRFMKDSLDLTFQLEEIDYSPANFVHADIDPAGFAAKMEEKGESLLSMMLKLMRAEMERAEQNPNSQVSTMAMLLALTSKDSARTMKMLLGKQFEDMEAMVAGLDKGAKGEGSTLLGERNKICIDVMNEQITAGKRRLAIFYGAAHLPDMERRLRELGFTRKSHEWIVAWDIPATKPAATGTAKPAASEPSGTK
ncbi:MAG: hypothetical protein JNL94_20280 [Planctomycetes bacterium]|nr:hypothetical protein [Planctomycetota bacterium]